MIAPLRRLTLAVTLLALGATPFAEPSYAQSKPRPAATGSRGFSINGYAMLGGVTFTAQDSFEAITGQSNGTIYGGGARVGLPWGASWGGPFIDLGAWRYQADGERAFVFDGTVYSLNVPVQVVLTPIELSAGWQFRFRRMPKFLPYVAAGLTSVGYEERSEPADPSDVDDSYSGYHVSGGAEYRVTRWVGIAGELTWSTVPDAIGEGGVSAAFNESDLGGTSFRVKITIGR